MAKARGADRAVELQQSLPVPVTPRCAGLGTDATCPPSAHVASGAASGDVHGLVHKIVPGIWGQDGS